MEILTAEIIEEEVIKVVKEICSKLKIDTPIDSEFCPGNFIKSQILLTYISIIGDSLNQEIPNDCYIFSDKSNKQLSIKETTQKILNLVKNG